MNGRAVMHGSPSIRKNVFVVSAILGGLLAIFGLATNRAWGRWLGLAIGVSGLALTTSFLVLRIFRWGSSFDASFVGTMAGLAFLSVLLFGAKMREHFGARGNPFRSAGRRATLLSGAMIFSLASVPTLWALGCAGPHSAGAFRIVALVASLFLVMGVLLLVRQRTAGLIAMFFGGALSLGLAVFIVVVSGGPSGGPVLSLQWSLAAFGAILALVATARPIARLLAGRPPV